jgi:tetratricopeptide (TPR) repeat protein
MVMFALLLCAGTAVLVWRWSLPMRTGPLGSARAAYDRRDWRDAAAQARQALKEEPNNPEALRLLARTSARMGSDNLAQEVYERLGEDYMQAEDYLLLGTGLLRQKQLEQAVGLLERARELDPRHAETLHELARLYSRIGRLEDAEQGAMQLTAMTGWEARGAVVLGVIRQERADPAGAAEALDRALRADPELHGATATPKAVRMLLSRSLLQANEPARAKACLEALIAGERNPEASWLLSRAYLQAGDAMKAAEALAQAGDYGHDDPLLPEPAPYVGSKACASCHPSHNRTEQSSRHARTLYLPKDLANFPLPKHSIPDPGAPGMTHSFDRVNGSIRLETRAGDKVRRALVEYALGSGDRGLTMIGRDEAGKARVFRISAYSNRTVWDLTPSASKPSESDPDSVIGRLLSAEAMQKCLECHITSLRAARDPRAPEAADRGIGCERCHGPGGNHVAAIEADFADLAIGRPRLATAPQITRLCGACHDSDDPSFASSDLRTVRFQTYTMPLSRCYTESGGGLSCLTCHDPHRDAETSVAHYELQCLSCHSATAPEPSQATRHAVLAEGKARVPCPVSATKDCLKCHMPATKSLEPYTTFTDHHIRVHPEQGKSSASALAPASK